MQKRLKKVLPCLFCAVLTGMGTGGVVYLFRGLASLTVVLSGKVFGAVRENPILIPVLIVGAAAIGILASLIVRWEPDVAGGGIPSSVAFLRGFVTMRWLRNIIGTAVSATLTYAAGVPLGTEGPCVQLGTAVGRGTVSASGELEVALERYSMTGGACAGFAAATGAPLTGILFALEEAHKKITPTLLVMAAVSVFTGSCTLDFLNLLTGGTHQLFDIDCVDALKFTSLWFPFAIGIVCGLFAVIFTVLHTLVGKFLKKKCKKIPSAVKFALVFAVSAVIGFFSDSFMGTGHDVAQNLISGNAAVRLLLTVLAVRAVLFIVSNNIGVTGGAFLPNLAFGALLGMLCAVLGQRLGAVDAGLTTLSVTLGMASFLGAVSKTPLMAIAFGIEALGGGSNVPAFVLATVTAYLVMEFSGVKEFADVAIEAKLYRAGHTPSETEKFYTVTVADGSFADDRRYDDLLLPYGVRIISENETLHSGDTVTLCFTVEKTEGIVETLYGIFGSKAEIKKQ